MSKLRTNYNLSKETTSLSILTCSRAILLSLCFLCAFFAEGKNSQTTCSQSINSAIDVSANTDYVLTLSSGIFGSSGSLNIPAASKEHSVIIFRAVKPSAVISTWLKYIKINGATAVDGTNCQVRMYNKGAIILPYGSSDVALTTYTGTDYTGTSCTSYSTGSNGGYMRTLTSSQLINNFRSFKLKRGYMVTFATGTSGYGYSRCFVAAEEDLEMNLPPVLAGKVSSYRLFKWLNFGKTGVANETREEVCDLLNVQGCYNYSAGENRTPDMEWLPHKIHKNWPGIADCGLRDFTCTMKTDNEPANSSDDTPATVDEVLAYWEDAMRTGLRLCSPSTYDGSVNADWFKEFFKKIDARGWRCDIYDIHCYWASFNNLPSYHDAYQRPLLISEWMWGASWNSNGCFKSGVTESEIVSETSNILTTLNNTKYVERYFYWNSESKGNIYDGKLTTLGQAYAATDGGLGYNAAYEFIPVVAIKKPFDLSSSFSNNSVRLQWSDSNGDIVDEIRIQYKSPSGSEWATLATVEPKEKTSRVDPSYTYSGTLANADSYCWRIVNIFDGKSYPSDVLINSASVLDDADFLPFNLSDYYFQFYSKEASANLVWAVYDSSSSESRVYYKAANSNYGSDLYQLWMVEGNANTGYYFRNLGEPGYYICSPNSWNFTTRNADYTTPSDKTTFGLEYQPNGDYWLCTNVAHGMYVGLWDNDKNFAAGEVLAGNRTNPTGSDSGDKLGIRLIPRKVVNDYLGYVTITSGDYYLYNPASNLFIAAGNKWDTQAITSESGINFTISPGRSGYLLDSHVSNGGTAHYLGSNLYCDSSPFEWVFAEKSTIDGHQAYTISNGTEYLSAPTNIHAEITTTTNANSPSALWLLLTRNELIERMGNATAEQPVDVTFLLPGASFGRNDIRINNWNGSPKRDGYAGNDWGDMNGEKFDTTYDVYQEITDVPDGIYEVSAQGFYRNGGYDAAANKRKAGNESLIAMLYGNDATKPLPSIFSEAGNCGTRGVNQSTYGYIPNSQSDASYYIHAGLYQVEPLRVTVNNNILRIGIKKNEAVTSDWTLFDNFQLKYLGPFLGDVNKDGTISIADAIAVVSIILGNDSTQPYLYDHVNADVNKDGYITISDAVAIVRMTLGQ